MTERTGGFEIQVEVVDEKGKPSLANVALMRGRPDSNLEAFARRAGQLGLYPGHIEPGVIRFRAVPEGDWTLVAYTTPVATMPLVVGPQLPPRVRFVVPVLKP